MQTRRRFARRRFARRRFVRRPCERRAAPGRARRHSPVLYAALWAVAWALPGQAPAQAKAQQVFADGQAQVVPAFADPRGWVRQELWVETTFDSDGDGKPDRMHVYVTRPGQTDTEGLQVPVVYETSPYYTGIGSTQKEFFWDPEHELGAEPPPRAEMPSIRTRVSRPLSPEHIGTWVPRGFAVVQSSSPGTGLSQGCPTVGGENESLAPKAVIDWLCGRAKGFTDDEGGEPVAATWCTGRVGMTGTSYNGTLPLAAATTGVDGLMAIIPVAPNTSYYAYYRSNGLVRHPGGYMGEDVDVLYDFINSGDPERREWCNKHVRDDDIKAHIDRVTGDYSEWWAARDYRRQLDNVKAAVLMAHAFNDWNVMPQHSVEVYAALKQNGVPCMAYFHQGDHGGPPPLELMNRWFTRYVCGVENGVEDDPRGWIVREGDPRSEPTPYPDYPHPDARVVTLHPAAGGAGVAALTVDAAAGRGTEQLVDDVAITGAELAKAAASKHRLLYATPELRAPVHISGTARLKIRLACDRPAANLSVWVVSLPWTEAEGGRRNGRRGGRGRRDDTRFTQNIITRGWADPQNSESLSASAPLEPGRFYDLAFDLQPDDQVIPVGARIGLMIFSSDRDFTLWPDPGTVLTVDLAGTSLDLPVVGGAAAFAKAVGDGQ